MKCMLLLLMCAGAATGIARVHDTDTGDRWIPRKRIHGWGADRHAPVLRVMDSDRASPARDRLEWIQWRATLGTHRSYQNTSDEELHARVFEETELMVKENLIAYEKGKCSYYLGINKFADLTQDEYAKFVMSPETAKARREFFENMNVSNNESADFIPPSRAYPRSVDWRNIITFTDIKNQGECGSCTAFSTISSIEAQIAIHKNVTVDLSEQFIMDCTWHVQGDFNNGCDGGLETVSFEWLASTNRSVLTQKQYPYQGKLVSCPSRNGIGNYKVKGYMRTPTNDEEKLASAVAAFGPITCGIYASEPDFIYYSGGIYDNKWCAVKNSQEYYNVDHAVVAIGYGTEGGRDYWILRNSWGKNWGEGGYMRLERGVGRCAFPDVTAWPTIY